MAYASDLDPWGTFGPHKCLSTMIVQEFPMDEYMEYQEEQAYHCLHARADTASGVQKYP